MCRAVLLNVLVIALVWSTFFGVAFCNEPPLVVGFDRFVPHKDIELSLGGNLLLSELSCTACHQTNLSSLQPKGGPRLEGAGERLQGEWIQQFLESPQKIKPGTTMPDVLAGIEGAEKQRTIAALTAFLTSQLEPYPTVKATGVNPVPFEFWNAGDAKVGKQLYHQVGCVACHKPADDYETVEAAPSPIDQLLAQLDSDELEEMGLGSAIRPVKSVPHGDLAAKYSRKSLTFFLMNPERVRPSGRMPSLKLKAMEAADIAVYLLKDQQHSAIREAEAVDRSLQEEGKRLFVELRCANCHTASNVKSKNTAKPLAEIRIENQENCLATVAKGRPKYSLDEIQTKAISAALAELPANEAATDERQLVLRMLQLNCFGCHERDELGGVGRNRKAYFETVRHVDIGDEGRLPPQLTGVGKKLTGKWLKTVFEGKGDVRPHVVARMPRFPAATVSDLPEKLAKVDRQAALRKSPKQPNDYVAAGRVLLDTGCVECHGVRGESLPGVVGIDLQGVTSRVEYGWFHEFLLNPAALKSRTRMPTFFPDGKSQHKGVLDGDTDQQIAAIWHYLRELSKHPLPAKIEKARSQDFELVPTKEPILLRTFMTEAGTHALAVGFKEKVHFAFDTERLRLAQAWRGRFLDAQGTWFERFTPPAVPLGEGLINLPDGALLAVLKNEDEAWPSIEDAEQGYRFVGYRLATDGVPTLLYRVGEYEVQDRITPNDTGGLSRRITITGIDKPGKLWLRANVGESLQQGESSTTNENGLTVQVTGEGKVRTNEGLSEWLIPVKVDRETTIEVRYQW